MNAHSAQADPDLRHLRAMLAWLDRDPGWPTWAALAEDLIETDERGAVTLYDALIERFPGYTGGAA